MIGIPCYTEKKNPDGAGSGGNHWMFGLHKFDKHPSAIWIVVADQRHTQSRHTAQAHSPGRHASESMSLDCHWTSVIDLNGDLNARLTVCTLMLNFRELGQPGAGSTGGDWKSALHGQKISCGPGSGGNHWM